MNLLNCTDLNSTFNISGPNYIEIEEYQPKEKVNPSFVKTSADLDIKKQDVNIVEIKKKDGTKIYKKEPKKKEFDYNEILETYVQECLRDQLDIMAEEYKDIDSIVQRYLLTIRELDKELNIKHSPVKSTLPNKKEEKMISMIKRQKECLNKIKKEHKPNYNKLVF
jgi:DNA-binding transcriptional regulator YhcF (GntR family)